jgi:alkylhydroperoxidase family enzyme
MARIPYPDPMTLPQATRDALARRRPLNVYRMIGQAETLAPPMVDLVSTILTGTALDPRLRELAILRVGHLCGSAYETRQHERIAREAGLTEAEIASVKVGGDLLALGPREQAVVRFAGEMTTDIKVSDGTFRQVAEFLSPREITELSLIAGFYNMVSRFLETLEIDGD